MQTKSFIVNNIVFIYLNFKRQKSGKDFLIFWKKLKMKIPKLSLINTKAWLDENKDCFWPPVCNKLMHNEQLIVMV